MTLQTISTTADVLLTSEDLPDNDDIYFKEINPKELIGYFEKSGIFTARLEISGKRSKLRRIHAILLLMIDRDSAGIKAIPIPFIVDTGAPGNLYLGPGAKKLLEEKKILISDNLKWDSRNAACTKYLKGFLTAVVGKNTTWLKNPHVEDLPERLLQPRNAICEDGRANILGLQAICDLRIIINAHEIAMQQSYAGSDYAGSGYAGSDSIAVNAIAT